MNRRQKTAEETRQNIVAAGRKLFAECGYAHARVEDIAKLAGVAPVTVYASIRGKAGIMQALVESCGEFGVRNAFFERLATATDPVAILEDTARTTRLVREEFEDVIYAMHDAAQMDVAVAEMLKQATEDYRGSCATIASRLMDVGGVRRGMSLRRATDLLWFHFGWWSWFALHNESGWPYSEAEQWLFQSIMRSVLEEDKP